MKSITLLSFGLTLLGVASAHMKMIEPPSINSEEGQYDVSIRDYNQMANILPDGSNFPCRGHHLSTADTIPRRTYVAGQQYSFKVVDSPDAPQAGQGNHGGGSCQFSLSYDNGKTFKVIKSIMGGCTAGFPGWVNHFTIPTSAPAANNVIFSWSWISFNGIQEFYQNCARVEIQNPAPQGDFYSLPNMFVANIAHDGLPRQCVPKLDTGKSWVVYPEPGNVVE
ncbi:hypothetical protein BZA77DRAFT_263208, partial [Pyronema omphalodes]